MVSALQRASVDRDGDVISIFEIAQCKKEYFDDGDWIESEHITDDGIRLIQTGNIGIGNFIENENRKFIYEDSFVKLKCKELRVGDLLICRLAEPAGRACVLPNIGFERIVTSVDVTIFRPPTNIANRSFLSALFSTNEWFKAVSDRSGGTTHKRISRGALGRIKIVLPHIDVQNAIAEILTDFDNLIFALEQAVAKKRAMKQGAMQELLFGRRRLAGFIGEWETRKFGAIATIRNDKISTLGTDVAAFCVELEHIDQGTGQLLGFSDARSRASLKYSFQKSDVLFGRLRPYLRKFWRADRSGVCSTEIWPLIPKSESLVAEFLAQIVQTDPFVEAAGSSYGTHMPRTDWKALAEHEIALPKDLDEQRAIAVMLSEMDDELELLTSRLAKARQIKQGMMQELLTGRVRLV